VCDRRSGRQRLLTATQPCSRGSAVRQLGQAPLRVLGAGSTGGVVWPPHNWTIAPPAVLTVRCGSVYSRGADQPVQVPVSRSGPPSPPAGPFRVHDPTEDWACADPGRMQSSPARRLGSGHPRRIAKSPDARHTGVRASWLDPLRQTSDGPTPRPWTPLRRRTRTLMIVSALVEVYGDRALREAARTRVLSLGTVEQWGRLTGRDSSATNPVLRRRGGLERTRGVDAKPRGCSRKAARAISTRSRRRGSTSPANSHPCPLRSAALRCRPGTRLRAPHRQPVPLHGRKIGAVAALAGTSRPPGRVPVRDAEQSPTPVPLARPTAPGETADPTRRGHPPRGRHTLSIGPRPQPTSPAASSRIHLPALRTGANPEGGPAPMP